MKDRATQALVKLALEPEWVERVDSLNNKIIGKNQKLSVKEGCLPPPGKRALNLTHTVSDQGAHVKMRWMRYLKLLDTSLNSSWMLISQNASTASTINGYLKN